MEDTELRPTPPAPGERLVIHSLLNAAGQAAPIVVGVFAFPVLVGALGTERFGLLTLAWSVIGYFSLFDLGLGRALTQMIAERRRETSDAALAAAVRHTLKLMTIVGVAAGVLAFFGAGGLERMLTVSPELRSEARDAFRLLAVSIPIVVLSTGFRGILEGYERFDLVNIVRVPLGIMTFLGPLMIAPYSRSLVAAVAVLFVVRVVSLVVQMRMSARILPLSNSAGARPIAVSSVLRSGAWMTVSNIISPIMTVGDRFLIGALLSATAVTYYTVPYEMATKLTAVVAVAVGTAIFPAFAGWRGAAESRALYMRGVALTAAAFMPLMIGVIAFAPQILTLWMGAPFARETTTVLRILGVGVLLNGLAQIPFAHIQAIGRADLTAKIHVAEVPAYLVLVVHLIRTRGVEGAALAWTIRVAVDTVVMFAVSRHLFGSGRLTPATADGAAA